MGFSSLFRKQNRKTLFTTPSHSQKYCILHKFRQFYKYDISETEAHDPEVALFEAEQRCSKIYGTKQTLFLTNGSSSGIITAVLSLTKHGDNVLVWRNAHRCHTNAIQLAGCNPIFYDIPLVNDWDVPDKVTVDILENSLKNNNIKVVLVTSPSYEGIVSDIPEIKKLCTKYGAYLVVDEAHGALYPFCDELPDTAINYADIVVQSLHKTAGGLNPTALIHSNIDVDIREFLNKINTTSPSYPLLASIEANVNFLNSKRGKKAINQLITEIKELRQVCNNVEFYGDDLTKILIKKDGISGYELSKTLFDKFDIEDEKTNSKSTMLLCGIGTDKKKLHRLINALKHI